jgi:pyruvate-formate lyase-activating enzyme
LAPPSEIVEEIRTHLIVGPECITLGGSGEPTLYEPIGELIAGVKQLTSIPVVVLTNGSLLWRPEIRESLLEADLVIPSLDAGDGKLFQAVNRPHDELPFERVLEGLIDFRSQFHGQYWLEVLLLAGFTGNDCEAREIAERVRPIRPHRVQLNTVARPPAEFFACPVPRHRLERIREYFDPPAEIIAEPPGEVLERTYGVSEGQIRDMLLRRPCSVGDLARGLGVHRYELAKVMGEMWACGALQGRVAAGRLYFQVTPRPAPRTGELGPSPAGENGNEG